MRTTSEAKPNRIGIRISDDTKERLAVLADRKGMSVSEYIRDMIENVERKKDIVERDSDYVEHNNDIVEQLKGENDRLKEQLEDFVKSDLPFDVEIELKDTLRMVELSSSKEEVPLFLKDLHDRLESGELQIKNGKLKLGYSEVFEILNRAETKKWLKGVWNMCEEKGLDYKTGLRSVFEMGSKAVISGMVSQQEVNYIP